MLSKTLLVSLMASVTLIALTRAATGVDVSQPTSETQFRCMKSNGIDFAIPRVFEETGACDRGGAESIKNAHAAGIKYVDGYHFPDIRKNAKTQIDEMLDCLRSSGAKVGTIWLDVEGSWSGTQDEHRKFIGDMAQALKDKGQPHGIYTSSTAWASITGDWAGVSNLPLWYPHWDASKSFGDFRPFGGWKKPSIKQYRGNTNLCGQGVDFSWY
jgi:hypothetical protein